MLNGYMHPHAHSSIIYNSQDMETTKCPLPDEWIKKMGAAASVHMMDYLTIKEILPFATTCMDFEDIMLNEINQAEKHNCGMISYVESKNKQTNHIHRKRDQICGYQRWEMGKRGN